MRICSIASAGDAYQRRNERLSSESISVGVGRGTQVALPLAVPPDRQAEQDLPPRVRIDEPVVRAA
jgi:hypothetical protein